VVLAACGLGPCSAADLLGPLFERELDSHQTPFAMGESIATSHLWLAGKLRRRLGADGIHRFTRP
jgi:hypothetical protein